MGKREASRYFYRHHRRRHDHHCCSYWSPHRDRRVERAALDNTGLSDSWKPTSTVEHRKAQLSNEGEEASCDAHNDSCWCSSDLLYWSREGSPLGIIPKAQCADAKCDRNALLCTKWLLRFYLGEIVYRVMCFTSVSLSTE